RLLPLRHSITHTAPAPIYPLSLHDALPISTPPGSFSAGSSRIVAQPQQPPLGIAWSILDVSTESVKQYGSFLPTEETIYLMTYLDRKSTRLNSSHVKISYAVFCLKKKNNTE